MEKEKNLAYFLGKYGIRLKKSLGQNFLTDKNIIRKEAAFAEIKQGETVLEIGPGVGFLTQELLKHAKKVIAIEKDKSLVGILKEEFSGRNLEIISADALDIDFPGFDRCISNIPYEISSKIILKLGKYGKPAILVMQKEFAERLTAKPGEGDYSKISVMSQYYFDSEILHIVSRKSFFPSPKVDSAIVRLTPRQADFKKSLGIVDEDFFLKTVHALFQHKNMTARNAIMHSRGELGFDKETAKKITEKISYKDAKVRTLDLAMLSRIANDIKRQSG